MVRRYVVLLAAALVVAAAFSAGGGVAANAAEPPRIVLPFSNHQGGFIGPPAYRLPPQTFRWGYFGASTHQSFTSHRGRYGDFFQWTVRRGY